MSARRVAVLAPAALAALALVLCAAAARAHDQPFSEVDVRLAPGRVALELTVHRVDAAGVLGVATPESLLVPTFLHERDGRLAALLAPRLALAADGVPLALRWRGSAIRAERRAITLRFDAPCPHRPGRLGVGARLFPDDPQHETFANVYDGDRLLRQEVLTARRPATEVFTAGPAGVLAVCLTFVPAGIHHILIGPDHILFLIGLLLLGGGWRRVLKIATGFTVAHSITLALAALELVQPPARLIEPAIALSVALVGLDNLRGQGRRDRRALLAFGFGLIHGFGFAGVLREFGLPHEALGWSLFAFNAGVELGQALVIAVVLPVLGVLRSRAPRLAPRIVTAGSWGVVLAGGGWLVQRLLLPA
jgi:hydrogenase/urease accessory protein HupE